MEQKYYCAICNAEVFLYDGVVERNCEHENAPVIADMEATATGVSTLE